MHKTLLPTYDIFDEYRYFEPAYEWNALEFKGKKLAVTICEDIWNLVEDPMYRFSPMEYLAKQQPDMMINLSASPFDYLHADGRKGIIKHNVAQYKLPMVYCNTVGAQTEVVFDGGSVVMDAQQQVVAELAYFKEDLQCVTLNAMTGAFAEQPPNTACY